MAVITATPSVTFHMGVGQKIENLIFNSPIIENAKGDTSVDGSLILQDGIPDKVIEKESTSIPIEEGKDKVAVGHIPSTNQTKETISPKETSAAMTLHPEIKPEKVTVAPQKTVMPEVGKIPATHIPTTKIPSTKKPEVTKPPITNTSTVQQVVNLVNEERRKQGVNSLTLETQLTSAAQIRAKEIEVSFSHTRPNGSSYGTVLTESGISSMGSGENIAWGQRSATEVMNGWMNSAGHRANILNSKYKSIGVGYYVNSSGRGYWTQLFLY